MDDFDLRERKSDADDLNDAMHTAEALRSRVYGAQTELKSLTTVNDPDAFEDLDTVSSKMQAMAELASEVTSILEAASTEASRLLREAKQNEEDEDR